MSRFAFCIVALLATSFANAASIKWTGYAKNGQWTSSTNWYPDQVPGPSDDVTINSATYGNVTITTPVTVQSITIGNAVGNYPFLIVDSSLVVESSLNVGANGGLVMNSGNAMVTGSVTMGGNLVFMDGTASGNWQIASPGKITMAGGSEKAFVGCNFNIGVDVPMSGVLVLNQSSTVTVGTGATATASGNFSIQAGDKTAVSFDSSKGTVSYNGEGAVFQVQAPWSVGDFNLNSGDMTLFDSITFGKMFNVPKGSLVKSLGTAQVAMPAGVSGAGYIKSEAKSLSLGGANFSGTIEAEAGVFESTKASTVANFKVSGATVIVNDKLSVNDATLTNGQIQGKSTFQTVDGSMMSQGFNINATTVITGKFTVTGSVISVGKMGGLTVAKGGKLTTTDATTISGPAGTKGVTNNGMIMVQGALSLTNVDLSGAGTVTVADMFTVSTITVNQATIALTGNGKFVGSITQMGNIGQITGTPGVSGSLGAYSFTCDKACKSLSTSGIPTTKFLFTVAA